MVRVYGESGCLGAVDLLLLFVLSLLLLEEDFFSFFSPDSFLRFFLDDGSWVLCLRLRSGNSVTVGLESISIASFAMVPAVVAGVLYSVVDLELIELN